MDGRTEYFDGRRWKPISQYKDGDHVLQYLPNGNALLTDKAVYIKSHKKVVWKLEMPSGLTICSDWWGSQVFKTRRDKLKSTKFFSLIEQYQTNSFYGRIIGGFVYQNEGIKFSDDEINLITLLQETDIVSYDNGILTTIVKKPFQAIGLCNLLSEMSIRYTQELKTASKLLFTIYNCPDINVWNDTKYNFTFKQAKYISDKMLIWNSNKHYTTNDKAKADYYQFLLTSTEQRGIYRTITDKHKPTKYIVRQSKHMYATLPHNEPFTQKDKRIKRVNLKDQTEHYLIVPSGMPVFRYQNNIYVTGYYNEEDI